MDTMALIPARGGSRSIPMKNITALAGKPLIAHSIEVAKLSRYISRVIVSTDSEEIREISLSFGAEAPFLRPAELAQDDTPDWPVFLHALEWLRLQEGYHPDIVVHLRPTTPLRRPEKLDEAIGILIQNPEADAVRSVSPPLQNPFKMWTLGNAYLKPLIDIGVPEPYNQPRQKLPAVYWQNGYVDVTRARTILEKKSMTGDRILPYIMEELFVVDIDQPFSLRLAEYLLQQDEY
jgi:CMP-N,N'-diacetyllegionaminic acid synthase